MYMYMYVYVFVILLAVLLFFNLFPSELSRSWRDFFGVSTRVRISIMVSTCIVSFLLPYQVFLQSDTYLYYTLMYTAYTFS